jgi:ATP-dependent DNA helicase RecQ
MTTTESALAAVRRLAKTAFGFESLRVGQEEAIEASLQDRDVLCVLPTGAGKSAIYQLVGMVHQSLTIVISPLIALQHDQVASLNQICPGSAVAVNSTISEREREDAFAHIREHAAGFLFLAPEQLARPETLAAVSHLKPGHVVVDEAHCIVEWGEDFRPDYFELGVAIEALGRPPIIALTATAAPPVRAEIIERLHLRDACVIVSGFDRPNIQLAVESFTDDESKTAALLEKVASGPYPGIIYAATRSSTEEIARELVERGIVAAAYHAGMKADERAGVQTAFMNDDLQVIVATTAFGMGIDKPDVRFVFHHDVSDSLDSYYQEIGRAGRDGEPAKALLFYCPDDLDLRRFQSGVGQLEVADVTPVISALLKQKRPIAFETLRATVDLSDTRLNRVLHRLEDIDAVTLHADGTISVCMPLPDADQAARDAVDEQCHLRHATSSKLDMMRQYAESDDCRRAFILQYFGEPCGPSCGNCDFCLRHHLGPSDVPNQENLPFPPSSRVRHASLGEGTVTRTQDDSLIVLFDEDGYRTLSLSLVRDEGLLTRIDR